MIQFDMHDIAIFETLLGLFGQTFLRPWQFPVEPDVIPAEQRVLDNRKIRGMIEVARRNQARVALHHAELPLALDNQRTTGKRTRLNALAIMVEQISRVGSW